MKNYIDANDPDFIDRQVTMRPEDIFHTGAILTGDQIKEEIRLGNIEISGFDPDRLNENSYNVTLSPTIMTYDLKATDDYILDVKNPPSLISATITEKYGYVIHPKSSILVLPMRLSILICLFRSWLADLLLVVLGLLSILLVILVILATPVLGHFRLSPHSQLAFIRTSRLHRSIS